MKKKILLLMGIFSIGILNAQVGINTQNPQGIFHIDPQNNTSGTANTSDDVIITANGSVGIGTVAPSTTLHIKTNGTASSPISGLRLEDGNQLEGRTLTSTSTSGLATWKTLTPVGGQLFNKTTTPIDISLGNTTLVAGNYVDNRYYNSGSTIVLSPGRWLVKIISLIHVIPNTTALPIWVSSTLSEQTSTGVYASIASPDIEGSGRVAGLCWGFFYETITGSMIINNTSSSAKTYYYMTGELNTYGTKFPITTVIYRPTAGVYDEPCIIAFKLPTNL